MTGVQTCALPISAETQVLKKYNLARGMIDPGLKDKDIIKKSRSDFQERMSENGAHIRDYGKAYKAVDGAWEQYRNMKEELKSASQKELPDAFRNLDLCLTHVIYLEAVKEYLEKGGKSRGSYLVLDSKGEKPCDELGDEWRFTLTEADSFVNQKILEIYLDEGGNLRKEWVDTRPVPEEEPWFENVWNEFMRDNIIK